MRGKARVDDPSVNAAFKEGVVESRPDLAEDAVEIDFVNNDGSHDIQILTGPNALALALRTIEVFFKNKLGLRAVITIGPTNQGSTPELGPDGIDA